MTSGSAETRPSCLRSGLPVLVWAGVALLALCALASREALADRDQADLAPEAVQAAIDAAARYLARATRDDGSFVYRVNANPTVEVKPRYNMLRHAGTIFALATYASEQRTESVIGAVLSAARYLKDRTIASLPRDGSLLAVWSRPDITNAKAPLLAKLGGTGLGLVALASVEKIEPGFTPLDDLRGLGRFVLFMQKANGSFYSKYIPSAGGRDDSWTSLYYPGEAALGLLMLYELDRDARWFDAAGRALGYLARVRENQSDVPADHWALLATAKMLSMDNVEVAPGLRRRLVGHAVQICRAILAQQVRDSASGARHGGFSADGRVTPTATRLEGLLAARSFLPANTEPADELDAAIRSGIAFLLRAQIVEGDFAGGFPRAIAKLAPDAGNAKNFNRRATEVRIDYVQHALSALIQYRAAARFR